MLVSCTRMKLTFDEKMSSNRKSSPTYENIYNRRSAIYRAGPIGSLDIESENVSQIVQKVESRLNLSGHRVYHKFICVVVGSTQDLVPDIGVETSVIIFSLNQYHSMNEI